MTISLLETLILPRGSRHWALSLLKKMKYTFQLRDRSKISLTKTKLCKLRVILRSRVLPGARTLVKDTGR